MLVRIVPAMDYGEESGLLGEMDIEERFGIDKFVSDD
jgi:hypothetical protein